MRWAQGVAAYIIHVPVRLAVVGNPEIAGSKGHMIIQ
jgi:hypothetical protein